MQQPLTDGGPETTALEQQRHASDHAAAGEPTAAVSSQLQQQQLRADSAAAARVKRELAQLLARDGFATVAEAVGAATPLKSRPPVA